MGHRPRLYKALKIMPLIGWGALFAFPAIQFLAQLAGAALGREHPGPQRPRRVVAHMLVVPARQFRDPMRFLVLVKPHYAPLHLPVSPSMACVIRRVPRSSTVARHCSEAGQNSSTSRCRAC